MLTIGLLRDRYREIGYVLGACFILTMATLMVSFTMSYSLYNSTDDLNPEKCTEAFHVARNYSVWLVPFCFLGMFICCSSLLTTPDYIYVLHGGSIINTLTSLWSVIVYSIMVSIRNDTSEDCILYWNKIEERVLIFLDFSYIGLVEGAFSLLASCFISCYFCAEARRD